MEEDLNLEASSTEWEFIDYHSYIVSAYNALMSLDGVDVIDNKAKAKKIEIARDKAIYLICRSVSELVRQFDEEHTID